MPGKEKLSHYLGWIPFKIGEWLFPVLEPFSQLFDNWDSEVKKYYGQSLKGLEAGKNAIALLNLNMVLSLKPDHFMAHVDRGRIYLKEKRYRLASREFLRASQISRYRFVNHDLYREYSKSINQESGNLEIPLPHPLNHPSKALQKADDNFGREPELDDSLDLSELTPGILSSLEEEECLDLAEDGALPENERDKFKKLGPITLKEIAETDWDKLVKELTS